MKLPRKTFVILSLALLASGAEIYAQGTFQNLGFEQAAIIPGQAPEVVSATAAVPGWSVYIGTNQMSQLGYNLVDTGSTWVSLIGDTGSGTIFNSHEGDFSLLLQGGLSSSSASISQTGLVPASAESIQFEAQAHGSGPLDVFLGGQEIPIFPIGTGPNYTLYGGSIAAFAGQEETLEFSAPNAGALGANDWNIDSIVFSPSPIPEPATWALDVCGVAILCVARQLRKP